MMAGRRIWLCVSVASLAVAMLAGCGEKPARSPSTGSALEKTHLTIGLSVPGATYLPLYVAADEGTFAKQGIQADVVEFRGGTDVIRAVVSGSVDVGVVALAEITSGIDAGQPLKAFYAGFNIPNFDWYGVSSIRSLAEAKGKTHRHHSIRELHRFHHPVCPNGERPRSIPRCAD